MEAPISDIRLILTQIACCSDIGDNGSDLLNLILFIYCIIEWSLNSRVSVDQFVAALIVISVTFEGFYQAAGVAIYYLN